MKKLRLIIGIIFGRLSDKTPLISFEDAIKALNN